jgi:uncharacterized LabA/DUF88 family protein
VAYPKKVMIFIDGSNFYHALKNLGVTSIDFKHLCDSLIGRERELVRVYYYNAPVNQSEEPEKYKRQQKFFNYLRNLDYFEVKLGRLEKRSTGVVEKGVDVKIATDMLWCAVQDLYDVAILISADGDFADVVQRVKDLGKHVEVAYPEGGRLYHLRQVCDRFIPLDSRFLKSSSL